MNNMAKLNISVICLEGIHELFGLAQDKLTPIKSLMEERILIQKLMLELNEDIAIPSLQLLVK